MDDEPRAEGDRDEGGHQDDDNEAFEHGPESTVQACPGPWS